MGPSLDWQRGVFGTYLTFLVHEAYGTSQGSLILCSGSRLVTLAHTRHKLKLSSTQFTAYFGEISEWYTKHSELELSRAHTLLALQPL